MAEGDPRCRLRPGAGRFLAAPSLREGRHHAPGARSSYETDAEFYRPDGSLWLQIEAKRDARQVDAIAAQLDRARDLRELPLDTVKEIEYVLELRPAYLWVVGPGSIDPPKHVFQVITDGRNARFERLTGLPGPPS